MEESIVKNCSSLFPLRIFAFSVQPIMDINTKKIEKMIFFMKIYNLYSKILNSRLNHHLNLINRRGKTKIYWRFDCVYAPFFLTNSMIFGVFTFWWIGDYPFMYDLIFLPAYDNLHFCIRIHSIYLSCIRLRSKSLIIDMIPIINWEN